MLACSGKVYYELLAYRRENKIDNIAIVRLEQQYPFPHADFTKARRRSSRSAKEVVWVQEEPQNQGAWYRLRAYLRADTPDAMVLAYAGRADLGVAGGRLRDEAPRRAEAADRGRVRARAEVGRDGRRPLNATIEGRDAVMRIEVKVPQLPESVSEATLVSWHKKAGDAVARDENLIDVETDKVVLELPAPGDGVLVELVKPDGATVTSNEVIAVIDTEAKGAARRERRRRRPPSRKPAAAAAAATAAAPAAANVTALPAARKMMAEQGVDPARVEGTGRGGRVTKGDVIAAVEAKAGARGRPAAPPRRRPRRRAVPRAGRRRARAPSSACRCRGCARAWPSASCSRSRRPRSSPRSTK